MLLLLKGSLELFLKRREFLPSSRVLSCRNITIAVESYVKTNSFLTSWQSLRELKTRELSPLQGNQCIFR